MKTGGVYTLIVKSASAAALTNPGNFVAANPAGTNFTFHFFNTYASGTTSDGSGTPITG
jgi:hypothetical protein